VENLSFVTQRGYVDNPLTACPPAWVIVPSPVLVRRGASGEANSSTQDLAAMGAEKRRHELQKRLRTSALCGVSARGRL